MTSVDRDFTRIPTDQPALRLVEGGFPDRASAEQAMFDYAARIRAAGQTDRFGALVRPMYVRPPGRAGTYLRRRSGWGVYVRDRACPE